MIIDIVEESQKQKDNNVVKSNLSTHKERMIKQKQEKTNGKLFAREKAK